MPSPPPLADILEALQQMVIPAAVAAALVFALPGLLGRRAAGLAAAVAIAAGFAAGNWTKTTIPWGAAEREAPWQQLPLVALALVVVAAVTQAAVDSVDRPYRSAKQVLLANVVAWLVRLVAIAVLADWVLPQRLDLERTPFTALFVAVTFLQWLTLDRIAAAGFSAEVSGLQTLTAFATGGLMMYAHWLTGVDVATIVGSAFLGLALVGAISKLDARAAIPASVGLLPGLIVSAKGLTSSEVPGVAFWIVGLAPLILTPWLLPAVLRRRGVTLRVCRGALVLLMLLMGVALAACHETLPWE